MKQPSSSKRQLAAILFADIVGYTSMMQADEGKTMGRLAHYQNVLKDQTQEHGGQIIKNYGDGSICLFSNTKSAVVCALAIQNKLVNDQPTVPLRIGIHLGDVIFKDNDIYGNSINLAARLESLGEPGSVLVSEEIYLKTKNQSELEYQSLGSFNLKNVDKPMEIFALRNNGCTVPDANSLKSKLKAKPVDKSLNWKRFLAYVGVLGLLTLSLFYFTRKDDVAKTPTKDFGFKDKEISITKASIRNHNVAVMVFEDQTNSVEFKSLGLMLSDWITQGLFEINKGKVVSAANVRYLTNQSPTQDLKTFAEKVGADIIIEGRYYFIDDKVFVNGNIVNPNDGKVLQTIPTASGSKSEVMAMVENFTQTLLGFWAASGNKHFDQNIPKYKAYNYVLEAEQIWTKDLEKTASFLKKAYEIDPDYGTPLLRLLKLYANTNQTEKNKELIRVIESKEFNLSELGQLEYESTKANLQGKKHLEVTLNEKIAEIDPSQAYMAGLNNMELNRTERSEKYLRTAIANITDHTKVFNQWPYGLLTHIMSNEGRFEECIEFIEALEFPIKSELVTGSYCISLAETKNWTKLDQFLNEVGQTRGPGALLSNLTALCTHLYRTRNDQLEKYHSFIQLDEKQLMPMMTSFFSAWTVGSLYYIRGEYELSAKFFALERYQGLSHYQMGALVKAGQLDKAEQYHEKLVNAKNLGDIQKAYSNYSLGQYYHLRGDNNRAIEYLKKAANSQMPFMFYSFDNDIMLRDLQSNPDFQALVAPNKG